MIRKTPRVAVPAQTNIVAVVVTNYVGVTRYLTNYVTVQDATTNAAGVVTPPVIQPEIRKTTTTEAVLQTNLVPIILPAKTYDELSLNPAVSGGLRLAGDVVPVPWFSGAMGLLITGVSSGLTLLNHLRFKKATKEKVQWQDTANVVIAGLEHLRDEAKKLPGYDDKLDENVMRVVKGLQYAAGVKTNVEDIVEQQRLEKLQG